MAQIETAFLESSDARLRLLNLGCVTQNWSRTTWPEDRSAVLGYKDIEAYRQNPHYLGAIIGRVANRIGGAEFSLEGTRYTLSANEGNNTLHGGTHGLSHRLWSMEKDGTRAVQFQLRSPDGDQGFPGDVDFTVTISLLDETLTYDMTAKVSTPTPINMTQHNYYNLNGKGTIDGHHLHMPAAQVLAPDGNGVPTQQISVTETSMDFRTETPLVHKDAINLDSHFCLPTNTRSDIHLNNGTDCALTMTTAQVGVQVYTAGKLSTEATPSDGQSHAPFCGLCLEPQGYPNAVNRPDFPSIVVTPDRPYHHSMSITLRDWTPS